VDLGEAAFLGAAGGALVSAAFLYTDLISWQKLRSKARRAHKSPISIAGYFDPAVDSLVLITRATLGAIAGLIFHTQVTGISAAIAIGAAAPLVVAQIGNSRRLFEARSRSSLTDDSHQNDTKPSKVDTASKAGE
jgi:hypothetical protein